MRSSSSSKESLWHLSVSAGSCIRSPDDFHHFKNPLLSPLLSAATMILKTLVSDQTACPVWRLLNPCRSVRRRTNSTKKNPQENATNPARNREGEGDFSFLKRSSHFLFCCSNPAVRLIVLLLSGNKSSTGLWSVREAHASRGRAHTHKHTPTRKRETVETCSRAAIESKKWQ